jgi:hypothetical protein
MEDQKTFVNQNYLNQAKKEFNLDDFHNIPNNREAFIKYTKEKLRYWIRIEYFDYFDGETIQNLNQSIINFTESGDKIHCKKDFVPITIGNFESELSEELKYLTITQDSPSNLKGKIEAYKKFLIEVERNFSSVDVLNYDCQIERYESDIFEQLVGKLIKKFFDIYEVYFDIMNAFDKADRSYRITLLSFDKNYYFKNYKKNESIFFILPKYLNPVVLKEFPKERLQFHKAIKTIINKQYDIRKTALDWDETPEEYKCIEEFAQQLTEPPVVESQPNVIKQTIQNNIQNEEEYPRHIFINKKAFLLFQELNEGLESIAQVSFLYRMMAEKDKLIVVKDTPFRDWYNENYDKIKLLNTTKTLELSTNKDRELWYSKVKALIYNK